MSAAPARSDIAHREDVSHWRREFYRRVFTDEFLGPVFIDVTRVDLAVHLPVMCDFWATVLRAGLYHCKALRPHVDLSPRYNSRPPISPGGWPWGPPPPLKRHTVKRAELAKVQAARIGGVISRRLRGRSAAEDSIIQTEPPDPRLP